MQADMKLMALAYGMWCELYPSNAFVNCSIDSLIEKKYYLPYSKINIDSILARKMFFYPLIYNDTIYFSNNYKIANLKGFDFKFVNGYKYDRFLKKIKKNKKT